MADATRRVVLGSVAGVLAGTAGCADLLTDEDGDPGPFPNGPREPATRAVRHPDGERVVRSPTVHPETDREVGVPSQWLVTSAKDRELLSFAPGAEGVPAVRRFLDRTDLAASTVLVVQRDVPPCTTRRVTAVRWGDSGVAVQWRDVERTGACDRHGPADVEALFVRVPGVVEELETVRFTPVAGTTMPP